MTPVQLAEAALNGLEQDWGGALAAAQCAVVKGEPRSLAHAFRRCLQSRSELVHWGVASSWVRANYRPFCEAAGAAPPPPYKDFARELATVMPRRRVWRWCHGRRAGVGTYYAVRDPADNVVALAKARRA